MKKGYTIAIVCLLLALCVLGGLIYFDLFHGTDDTDQQPVDMADFAQAIQKIEDSRTISGHLWVLKEHDTAPTLFRFEHSPTFTVKILKENKAACLYTFYETDMFTLTGYYDLYYDKGWQPELTDDKPVMIVEEITYNPAHVKSVEVVFGPANAAIFPTADQLVAIKGVIEKRLTAQDITDYEIYADEANGQVVTRFLWLNPEQDIADFVADLSKTGALQFYEGNGSIDTTTGYNVPPDENKLVLCSDDVISATAMVNQDATNATSPYVISLKFNDAGTAKFAAVTERLAASKGIISIWLDFGEEWAMLHNQPRYALLSSPTVESPITGAEAIITGFAAYEDAKEIADLITAGTLPFAITDKSLNIYN